ncbi:ATP-binding protein [Paenibacillus sp. GCM10027626]|uniref:ATP-binding protein n=1 Tax=Paenibacillus sp. GCM10027626 TaxID=3273411 RepID=UPI00362DA318
MDILLTDQENNPFQQFFEHTSELMVIADLKHRVLRSNSAFNRFQNCLGVVTHDSIIAHLHPDDWPQFSGQWNNFIRYDAKSAFTLRYCSLDNQEFAVQWRATKHHMRAYLVGTVQTNQKETPQVSAAAARHEWTTASAYDQRSYQFRLKPAVRLEYNQHQTFEERLFASNQRFSVAFHNAPTINFIITLKDHCIVEANCHFLALLPAEQRDAYRIPLDDLNLWPDPQHFCDIKNIAALSGSVQNQEIRFCMPSGKLGTGLLSGELVTFDTEPCMLFIMNDITEAKEASEQIALLDKYHLLGSMAASIAHEVRNPLTTVKGFLQLFLRKEELTEYQSRYSLMINELERANSIITEYLSLASNKSVDNRNHNLNDIIGYLCPLLEADALENGVNLEVQLGTIPPMQLNEKEIRQLLLNLSRNAIEAMSGKEGNLLSIQTCQEDDQIILVVRDQGPGIDSRILGNIFTPFFTTKAQGTGLGLAVCLSIAERHHATINVDSGSEGTEFRIAFNINKSASNY